MNRVEGQIKENQETVNGGAERYAIEISGLTKNYGKRRGVKNISLTVKEGDIFGFLGPNGAGKSTTIRSMLGLIRFQEGQIRLLQRDAVKNRREVLSQIGYMPSEAMFYPTMKVKDVIAFAAEASDAGRAAGFAAGNAGKETGGAGAAGSAGKETGGAGASGSAGKETGSVGASGSAGAGRGDCTEESERICELLKVDREKKIEELSLGNRKKVSIVCAMQHKPRLLILDEPTSGLDPLMQEAFFKLILEYNAQGTTCFLSSHVISEVKRYCRNAAIIRDGAIIRIDTVENLSKSNLRRIKLTENGIVEEFVHTGSMKELLKKLEGRNVEDLLIEEPSLEELFIHYYDSREQ